jgi:membrane protease YdiL (CAAX protease family)
MKIDFTLFAILSGAVTLIFLLFHFRLFVPNLFLTLNFLLYPFLDQLSERVGLNFPGFFYLSSMVLYLIIVVAIPTLKREVTWLRLGTIDRKVGGIIGITAVGSALLLLLWSFGLNQDLSGYIEDLPDLSPLILILGGLLFSAFNAVVEEFLARGILWDGFRAIYSHFWFINIMQALIFSIWHYYGFPGGLIGSLMVFFWSLLLGWMKQRSRGMLAPVMAHFAADFTIFLIVYLSAG